MREKRATAKKKRVNYYPFGLKHKGYNNNVSSLGNSTAQKFGYNGKELNEELGIQWHDFGARNYDASLGRWMNLDPLAEETMQPYSAMNNNPIMFVDPDGRKAYSPIYGTDGTFLGTDDQGLQGKAIVMNAENFEQGMSHDDAMSHSLGAEGLESTEAASNLVSHYNGLKDRPDYDGFVTVSEGIDWAKANPGALDNPTPDNMLYLDASKLDFGNVKITDFENGVGKSSPINTLNPSNLLSSVGNGTLRATVYALGRVDMNLLDNNGNVSIVNNNATDYDWNTGGTGLRNTLIRAERARAGLNDTHGFRTFYYGRGTLNKPKKPFTPQFPTGPKF